MDLAEPQVLEWMKPRARLDQDVTATTPRRSAGWTICWKRPTEIPRRSEGGTHMWTKQAPADAQGSRRSDSKSTERLRRMGSPTGDGEALPELAKWKDEVQMKRYGAATSPRFRPTILKRLDISKSPSRLTFSRGNYLARDGSSAWAASGSR